MKKLVLTKNTIKNIKIKSNIKTGDTRLLCSGSGGGDTADCSGSGSGGGSYTTA